jgi:hypothetical protein
MTPDDSIPGPPPLLDEWPMSHWLHKPATRQDVVTIRKVWVTLAVSLLVHTAALLMFVTHTPIPGPDQQAVDQETSPIQVDLAEAKPPLPSPAPLAPSAAARPRGAAPARVRPPPMVACRGWRRPRFERRRSLAAGESPRPRAAASRPPAQGDFLAFVQANRRARGG